MPDTPPQDPTPPAVAPEELERIRREAMEQARKEERDKLYAQLNKGDDRFKEMQAEVKRLQDAENARAKEAEKAAKQAEAARKAKEEAEMSAKELLAQREQTWQQKLDEIKAEQDARMAQIAEQQKVQQAMCTSATPWKPSATTSRPSCWTSSMAPPRKKSTPPSPGSRRRRRPSSRECARRPSRPGPECRAWHRRAARPR
jgi:hypothetical protein